MIITGCLDGKVVIITGAAHGMGISGVKLMAREGAKVVATGIIVMEIWKRIFNRILTVVVKLQQHC